MILIESLATDREVTPQRDFRTRVTILDRPARGVGRGERDTRVGEPQHFEFETR